MNKVLTSAISVALVLGALTMAPADSAWGDCRSKLLHWGDYWKCIAAEEKVDRDTRANKCEENWGHTPFEMGDCNKNLQELTKKLRPTDTEANALYSLAYSTCADKKSNIDKYSCLRRLELEQDERLEKIQKVRLEKEDNERSVRADIAAYCEEHHEYKCISAAECEKNWNEPKCIGHLYSLSEKVRHITKQLPDGWLRTHLMAGCYNLHDKNSGGETVAPAVFSMRATYLCLRERERSLARGVFNGYTVVSTYTTDQNSIQTWQGYKVIADDDLK